LAGGLAFQEGGVALTGHNLLANSSKSGGWGQGKHEDTGGTGNEYAKIGGRWARGMRVPRSRFGTIRSVPALATTTMGCQRS